MTIPASTRRNDYIGNGATSVYSYNFRIFSGDDLLVTQRDVAGAETTLTYLTDYTVNGVGSASGGSITLSSALADDYTLTIRRLVSLTQETDIRNQGSFYPETHEDTFDYLTMIDIQQQDELDRSLKFSETDPSNGNIPGSFDRAGKFLAFDQDGSPIASAGVSEVPVSAYMATVLDDPTAAAARTTLGFDGASKVIAAGDLADGSVAAVALASNAVETAKIKDANVTRVKIDPAIYTNAKSSAYPIVALTDDFLEGDATSAAFTFTLPAANTVTGRTFTFVKTDSSVNKITITDSTFTKALCTQGESIKVISNGTTYKLIDRFIPSAPVSFTPTVTNLGTISSVTAYWDRTGKFMNGSITFTTGSTVASAVSVSIPSGYTIDTSYQDPKATVGTWSQTGTPTPAGVFLQTGTSTSLLYLSIGGQSYQTPATGSNIPNSAVVTIRFRVPISGWEG